MTAVREREIERLNRVADLSLWCVGSCTGVRGKETRPLGVRERVSARERERIATSVLSKNL